MQTTLLRDDMEFPNILQAESIAFDTETTGLNYGKDKVFGFSIALPNMSSYYWDIRKYPQAVQWFNDQMRQYKGKVITANQHFDGMMSHTSGIYLPIDQMECCLLDARLIDEHLMSYALDDLAQRYIKEAKDDSIYAKLAEIFGGRATRGVQMKNLHRAPDHIVSPYAKQDALVTLKLAMWQREEIKRQGIEQIVAFERRLAPHVQRQTRHGVRVDVERAERAMGEVSVHIDEAQHELNKIAGFEVNVNSGPQMLKLFNPKRNAGGVWETASGMTLEQTDSGAPSFASDTLKEWADRDPKARLVANIRSYIKTRDTFLAKHILGHQHEGRVYPHINQLGTDTGRFSITDPALQQLPSRGNIVAKIIKECFLPDEGHYWLATDVSSQDVRCFAHLVNSPILINEYRQNPSLDLHQYVADLLGIPRSAKGDYVGANAKTLNLSAIFNTGKGSIAESLGLPYEWSSFKDRKTGKIVTYKKAGDETERIMKQYHSRIPGIKELAARAEEVAKERGYLFTVNGRRLRFPRGAPTYKASGLLIQATAAEVTKGGLISISDACSEVGAFHVLNVHDSFNASVPIEVPPQEAWDKIRPAFEEAHPWCRVPMKLDLEGTGKNYGQAAGAKGKFLHLD